MNQLPDFEKLHQEKRPQLIMFTGGRDSTLTAATLMLQNIPVHLFTGYSGCGLHRDVLHYRVDELRRRFEHLVVRHHVEDISGSFRQLAILSIEKDILRYLKNLVLLGEKLAIHVHVINYCYRNGITICNDGITSYQSDFAEQRDCARQWMKSFMKKHGLQQNSPIYRFAESEHAVKDRLFQMGLSPKSLEGVTIFADSFSKPSSADILGYLNEKEATADQIIHFLTGRSALNEKLEYAS